MLLLSYSNGAWLRRNIPQTSAASYAPIVLSNNPLFLVTCVDKSLPWFRVKPCAVRCEYFPSKIYDFKKCYISERKVLLHLPLYCFFFSIYSLSCMSSSPEMSFVKYLIIAQNCWFFSRAFAQFLSHSPNQIRWLPESDVVWTSAVISLLVWKYLLQICLLCNRFNCMKGGKEGTSSTVKQEFLVSTINNKIGHIWIYLLYLYFYKGY